MRNLGGLVLLSGIGVALFVYLPAPVDRSSSLDKLRDVATASDVQLSPSGFTLTARLRAFSPSIALASPPAPAPEPALLRARRRASAARLADDRCRHRARAGSGHAA